MLVTTQRISGRQQMESKMFRAADGVGIGYETLSTFASGRVKQAKSPDILTRIIGELIISYVLSLTEYGTNPTGEFLRSWYVKLR
jgi:hypothetical protein